MLQAKAAAAQVIKPQGSQRLLHYLIVNTQARAAK